jgi:hypothetical protein
MNESHFFSNDMLILNERGTDGIEKWLKGFYKNTQPTTLIKNQQKKKK